MEDVVWFLQIDKNDIDQVGGKGANLGELTKIGAPVPNGFIVTAQAYRKIFKSSGALDRIKGILYGLNVEDPLALQKSALLCQKEIKNLTLEKELEQQIFKFYDELSQGHDAQVAVRSSATAEDLPNASFAGQQATFLNIKGKKELIEAILGAWASLFEARAIFYRVQQKFDHFKVAIAVPVQLMVQSETSGVMFTVDPVTNDKNTVTVEAVFGLGELIVSGQATPDHYEISKKNFEITNKNIVAQEKQLVKAKTANRLIPIAKAFQKAQKLPDEKIKELARIGKKIEDHYYFGQDIEWAYEKGKLYIVQTRPITTIKNQKPNLQKKAEDLKQKSDPREPIVIGAPASPAIASGKVVIIKSPKELNRVQKGDVLVVEMTNPDYVPAMKKAVAIVTDKGGRTSHAAIVSRELGIACVVGTQDATKKLKEGMVVTVDGAKGAVYKGGLQKGEKVASAEKNLIKKSSVLKTATKLYVNLAEPQIAHHIAAYNVDGVGLLRAEFMLAQIGTHPKKFLAEKRQEEFISLFQKGLEIFGKAFGSRPVIYRASDLKSNEYRHLKGGESYEPKESNPMLGYRGAFRYLKDPDIFKLELEVLKRVRKKHKNIYLMIPFVRTPEELKAVRDITQEAGMFEDKDFKFYMMAELPTNIIRLEDFIKVGVDGISIGSNDLTMLILGTDRDNEEVASEFWEMDKSVLWALQRVIKTCKEYNITCSICGQAPSFYPELTEKLVDWGINSISVNPDKIDITRQIIYDAERKLISKNG